MGSDTFSRRAKSARLSIPRFALRKTTSIVTFVMCATILGYNRLGQHISYPAGSLTWEVPQDLVRYPYEEKGVFVNYPTTGYDNSGRPGGAAVGQNLSCSELSVMAEIGVQKPWDIEDNLSQIAQELDDHPLVYYTPKTISKIPSQDTFSIKNIVDQSWDRLAGSCVFLKTHGVHLCITRVIFHDDGRKDHCQISFLRGQIFDRSWVHLDSYTLNWKGRDINFPRIFDTNTEFVEHGEVYGPEDPRIIIDESDEDAEPVIVFNMISERAEWNRAMWIFRPFSQYTTILTIQGEQRHEKEKNWAPFFVQESAADKIVGEKATQKFIHFVYNFHPLEILKCGLIDGMCTRAFGQNVPEELQSHHNNEWSELRGGTQFVPIPLFKDGATVSKDGLQAFAAFPRTHTEQTTYCEIAVYRPELVVMITNGTSFYLSYVSSPLDFGLGTVLDYKTFMDPCKSGRIMIINSIAHWDLSAQTAYTHDTDVMTLTLTVNDATVQAMRISGILKLIRGLPSIKRLLADPGSAFEEQSRSSRGKHIGSFNDFSAVGLDVRSCAEEEVRGYIDYHTDSAVKAHLSESKLSEDKPAA